MKKNNRKMNFLLNYWHNIRASVLPITAFMFPVIMGVAALGVDASMWMAQKRDLQTAVDAGAIAGAWELSRGGEEFIDPVSLSEAVANGFNPANNGAIQAIHDINNDTVEVTLSEQGSLYLSSLLLTNPVLIQVSATAQYVGVTDDFCILSLNEFDAGSLTTSGSIQINMPDCGIAVNSSDAEAMQINGNATIDVDNVSIVGGYNVSGGSADLITNSLTTGANPVADPYADMEVPEATACDFNNYKINGSGTFVLSPGTYCGGIRATGTNNIEFLPGTYIIDGGALDLSGGGTVFGDEVSFYLTGDNGNYATLDITGGRDIFLSAPPEGDMLEGVVFYQDRSATAGSVNNILGNADIVIDGAMYFPNQEINFGGNTTAVSDICTKIVGDHVIIHGNPYIGNDCSNKPAKPIGNPIVKLII